MVQEKKNSLLSLIYGIAEHPAWHSHTAHGQNVGLSNVALTGW